MTRGVNFDLHIFCCSAKVTVISLSVSFFLSSAVLAAALAWQYHLTSSDFYLYTMSIPASLVISCVGLTFLACCHHRFLLLLFVFWPLGVISVLCWFIHKTCYQNTNWLDYKGSDIVASILPLGALVAILLSTYCIVLLFCLSCSPQSSNKTTDLYEMELGSVDGSDSSEQVDKDQKFVIN